MLTKLTIRNYVLIKHLEMRPSAGMSIITGETGAGKSIMLGAVGLLLGNRADTKVLSTKDEKCIIEGVFNIENYGLEQLFAELDLDYDQQTIIRREISQSGKSRAFINDTPVLLESLRQIGERLLDVHSQHDTFDLGEQSFQLELIDAYAGTANLLSDYRDAFLNYSKSKERYEALLANADSMKKEQDYDQFLFDELEKPELEVGEQEKLEEELRVLEHAEEIKTQLNLVIELLSDPDHGVLSILAQAKAALNRIGGYSHDLSGLRDRSESNLIDLTDLQREVESEEQGVEFDPARQNEINNKLSEIYRLQQKHNVHSVDELINIREKLAEKLTEVSNLDEAIEKAGKSMQDHLSATTTIGRKLSASRQASLEKLSTEIRNILVELAIPDARLPIELEDVSPGISGMDKASFLFSANKGIPPESLKKVASGGEFSRLMFAIKYVMAGKTSLPTIIFDEIDTGVSGEIALRLGQLMKEMGKKHQIITITHLPQIAARGDMHYFVYKETGDKATASHIRELDEDGRIDEIAKMIAGDNPSNSALESARELVEQ